MKTHKNSVFLKGFTLVELMVAMAITTIIVAILVQITSMSLDTWNRSRTEARAARQAKTLVDTMAHDLESLIVKRGNNLDWLYAEAVPAVGPENAENTNAAKLNFYTAAPDRYNGNLLNTAQNKGGDVSTVAYRLFYTDPIADKDDNNMETFVVYRMLVDPDVTYREFLGGEDLDQRWAGKESAIQTAQNFVCENIYQFSLTFNVVVEETKGNRVETQVVPVTISNSTSESEVREFRINGAGLIVPNFRGSNQITADQFRAGKITSVEISLSVISDTGLEQMRRRKLEGDAKAAFLSKNSFQYSKLVHLPTL